MAKTKLSQDQVDHELSTDANGWQCRVIDGKKVCTKSVTANLGSIAAGAVGFLSTGNSLPSGITDRDDIILSVNVNNTAGNAWSFNFGEEDSTTSTTLNFTYKNIDTVAHDLNAVLDFIVHEK
jgi:hypothetical protein